MPPKTSSDDFAPDPLRGNASDPGQIADPHRGLFLPTWNPDAPHRDGQLAKIYDCETNGEYTAFPDANNPTTQQRSGPGAFLDSDGLHTRHGAATGAKTGR